jgi:WXXGXW repeat (2 copies)
MTNIQENLPMGGCGRLRARSRAPLILISALLALFVSAAVPVVAREQVALDVVIRRPPPAARVEVVPAPRVGYVWAQGYWLWDGHRHIWRKGHWEAERPGQRYVAARWIETPEGWRFVRAHWEHFDRRR